MTHYPGPFVDPVTKLPGELFHRTAELLTLNERFRVALVSRSWRRVMFDAPLLWSTISICPRTDGKLRFVAEVLDAFLQRSRGVTVTVHLFLKAKSSQGMSHMRRAPSYGDIPHVLEREMHRVRVLELVLHDWSRTAWKTVLRQPAPALERFVLIVSSGEDDNPLPNDLFANKAPSLRELHLRSVTIPKRPGAALAGLTSFHYNYAGNFEGDVLKMICAMRNLQDLTIAASDEAFSLGRNFQPPPLGPQLRRVQLWNAYCAREILQFFPPPRHVCYSASLTHDLSGAAGDASLLVEAVRAKGAARSVVVGFRAPRLSYFDSRPAASAVYAVRLDGSDVVVDLELAELNQLVQTLRPDSLLAGLQSLAIPISLLPLFDLPGLPELHDLTLFVPPPGHFPPLGDIIPETQHTHRVHCLRIVQVIAPQQWPSWNMHKMRPAANMLKQIPGGVIMRVIQDKLVAETLQQVVLDGYLLAQDDYEGLRGIIPHVSSIFTGGWLQDDDSGQWQWRFPKETAFRT